MVAITPRRQAHPYLLWIMVISIDQVSELLIVDCRLFIFSAGFLLP